jgi:hypothetical protein
MVFPLPVWPTMPDEPRRNTACEAAVHVSIMVSLSPFTASSLEGEGVMYKLGISFILLALLSGAPTTFAVDRGVSGLSRAKETWLVRQASSTACPFRRFPWLCHRPSPRRPR